MKRFIVGNWKMHKTIPQAEALLLEILNTYQPHPAVELVVAPPYVSLPAASRLLHNTPIQVAAQNVCAKDEGAFTGEVSPVMIKDLGCTYVILGHSERRHLFGETDQVVNEKVHAALRHGLRPIFCVGERLEEREAGHTQAVVQHQLEIGLSSVETTALSHVIIAYEPVWAIGTGHAATVAQASEVHAHIRSFLASQWKVNTEETRVLYGGSVTAENAQALFDSPEIHGALIGKACLNSESFVKIAMIAASD